MSKMYKMYVCVLFLSSKKDNVQSDADFYYFIIYFFI